MRKTNFEFSILSFKSLIPALLLLVISGVQTPVLAGQFYLGEKFYSWDSNYQVPSNVSGYEFWTPMSLSFSLAGGFNLYAQTEYGKAGYTYIADINGVGVGGTDNLSAFSDTLVGAELNFKSFSIPSILNVGFNIPTGDPTWEVRQIASNLPTDLVNSRYRGRGFGVSAMYALSFPSGSNEFGVSGGYMYSGLYNANLNLGPADNLDLGDSIFLALNHVSKFSENRSQIIRLSGFVFLSTVENGITNFQMGPNINASYSWTNPTGFSFTLGGQYFLPAQRAVGGVLAAEVHNSYGPRVYLNPSLMMGDFAIAGRAKYVFENGYPQTDPLYQVSTGGLDLGLEPSVKLRLGGESAVRIAVSYDSVMAQNAALDETLVNRTNVFYNLLTFGSSLEVKF